MKFGNNFVSQMVPEWHETYMDYNHLKSLLKEIQQFKLNTKPSSPIPRSMTLHKAFNSLTERYDNFKRQHRGGDVEDQVILTNNEGEDDIHGYRTIFLMSGDQGGDFEQGFFNKLDDEFNKVVKFYKKMVEEMLKEDDMLNKQMDALIAFRIKVENPDASVDWSQNATQVDMMRSSSDDDNSQNLSQDGRAELNDTEENEETNDNALNEEFKKGGKNTRTCIHGLLSKASTSKKLQLYKYLGLYKDHEEI